MRKLAFILLFVPLLAVAETVTWNRPTTYTNGDPLPLASITGYEFRCTATSSPGFSCPVVTVSGAVQTATIVVTVPAAGGTFCVEGRAFAGAANPSIYGGGSGAACKTFAATPPGPPTNVTIAVVIGVNTSPAYGYNAKNVRLAEPMGFIAVGKPCTGSCLFNFRGECYRKVARSDVQWWIAARDRIAAACRSGSVVRV